MGAYDEKLLADYIAQRQSKKYESSQQRAYEADNTRTDEEMLADYIAKRNAERGETAPQQTYDPIEEDIRSTAQTKTIPARSEGVQDVTTGDFSNAGGVVRNDSAAKVSAKDVVMRDLRNRTGISSSAKPTVETTASGADEERQQSARTAYAKRLMQQNEDESKSLFRQAVNLDYQGDEEGAQKLRQQGESLERTNEKLKEANPEANTSRLGNIVKAAGAGQAAAAGELFGQLLAPTETNAIGPQARAAITGDDSQIQAELEKDKALQERIRNRAASIGEDSAEFTEQAKEGLGTLGQLGVDAGVAGLTLAGDIALASATGGSSLLPMAGRVYLQGAQQARLEGANTLQQALAGAGKGIAAAATSKLLNLATPLQSAYGGGVADDIVNGALSKLSSNPVVQSVLKLGVGGAGEVVEEALEFAFGSAIEYVVYNKDAQWSKEEASEALYEGVVGGILGALGGSVDVASAIQQNRTQPVVAEGTLLEAQTAPQSGLLQEPTVQQQQLDVLERLIADNQPVLQNTTQQAIEQQAIRQQQAIQQQQAIEQQAIEQQAIEQQAIQQQTIEQQAIQQQAIQQQADILEADIKGVGAAELGFDPVSRAMNESGVIRERLDSNWETPRRIAGGTVSQAADTIIGSDETQPETRGAIEEVLASGRLNKNTVTDAQAWQMAQDTLSQSGYAKALADWTVRSDANITTDYDTPLSILLYRQAQAEGDTETAMDILYRATNTGSRTGRKLRQQQLWESMPREQQLQYLHRTVDELNNNLTDKQKTRLTQRRTQEDNMVDEAWRTVAMELTEQYRTSDQKSNRNSSAAAEWATQIGDKLAKAISANVAPSSKKTSLTSIIKHDLSLFSQELYKRTATASSSRTSIDVVRDFFANRSLYADAWNQARNIVKTQYADNEQVLDRLDSWLNGSITYNAEPGRSRDGVILKAALQANDTTKAQINKLAAGVNAFGSRQGIADLTTQLTQQLSAAVGATAEDSLIIRDAIAGYFADTLIYSDAENAALRSKVVQSVTKDAGYKMSELVRQGVTQKQAAAEQVASDIIAKYGFSEDVAQAVADTAVTEFFRQVEERALKTLESKLKPRDATTRKSVEQKLREYGNLGAFNSDTYNAQATAKIFGQEGVTIDRAFAEQFLNAQTDAEADAALENIYQNIAQQIPATFWDRWNAWRHLSMLGNLRTHDRNIVGNVLHAAVRAVSDTASTTIQYALPQSQREQSFVGLGEEASELRAVAKADAKAMKDVLSGDGKYSDLNIKNEVDKYRNFFGTSRLGRIINWAAKGNNKLLDVEDALFSTPAYRQYLARYLKAKGITAQQWQEMTDAQKAEAREYAVKRAQQAVFRANDDFSDTISRLGSDKSTKTARAIGHLVDAVQPYKRTPANILVTVEQYSPLGLINTAANTVKAAKGDVAAARAIDSACRSVTGTVLAAAGYILAKNGLLTGRVDDELEQLQGHQSYAFELFGHSYTLPNLGPAVVPLLVGAEIAEIQDEEEGSMAGKVLNALLTVAEPVFETTMLSGLNDALSTDPYADENALIQFITRAVTNYLGQGISSMGSAIANTLDDTRRTTYSTETGAAKIVDTAVQSNMNRMLGLREQGKVYVDRWGRTEDTGTIGQRAVENFLSPGYYNKIQSSPMEDELRRVMDATGEDVLPKYAPKSMTYKDEKRELTAEDNTRFQTTMGQMTHDLYTEITEMDGYGELSDEDKVKLLQEARSIAENTAKQEFWGEEFENKELDKLTESGLDTATALLAKVAASEDNMPADKTADGDTVENSRKLKVMHYVDGLDLDDSEKAAMLKYLGQDVGDVCTQAVEKGISYSDWTKWQSDLNGKLSGDGKADVKRQYISNRKWTDEQKVFAADKAGLITESMEGLINMGASYDQAVEAKDENGIAQTLMELGHDVGTACIIAAGLTDAGGKDGQRAAIYDLVEENGYSRDVLEDSIFAINRQDSSMPTEGGDSAFTVLDDDVRSSLTRLQGSSDFRITTLLPEIGGTTSIDGTTYTYDEEDIALWKDGYRAVYDLVDATAFKDAAVAEKIDEWATKTAKFFALWDDQGKERDDIPAVYDKLHTAMDRGFTAEEYTKAYILAGDKNKTDTFDAWRKAGYSESQISALWSIIG